MWFYHKSEYFKEAYIDTVLELEKEYIRTKDYKNRFMIYSKAAAIYPFDNWQIRQIRCNLEIYRYEEALEIYNNTMELYSKEMGTPPTAEMQECFEKLELADENHRRNMNSINGWKSMDRAFMNKKGDIRKAIFEEEKIRGAYYCTYPSFVDYCRLVVRAKERNQFAAVLMFLTLSWTDDNWDKYVESANELADTLIQYTFRQNNDTENLEELTFSGWVSDKEDNNYVLVSYKKDGVTPNEYFDYEWDDGKGEIVLLKKTAVYKDDANTQLAVVYDKGEPIYKLNGEEIDTSRIKVDEDGNGFTLDADKEVTTVTYERGWPSKKTFKAVTVDGKTTYYDEDGKKVNASLNKGKLKVDGYTYQITNEKDTITSNGIRYENTGTFVDKGTPYVSVKEFDNGADEYQQKTNVLREEAEAAKKAQEATAEAAAKAADAAQTAATKATEAKNAETKAKAEAEKAKAEAEAKKQNRQKRRKTQKKR